MIDGIALEAVWFDGEATDDWEDSEGYDFENDAELVQWHLASLEPYQEAEIPVFDCEYALQNADRAYSKSYGQGFAPYCTRRPLSKLTTTLPPDY